MSVGERYRTPAAFRTALEDRLRQSATGQSNQWILRRRKFMVFDRLLARLLVIAQDRWLLKGAVALDFRLGSRARATMDLDLYRAESETAATQDLIAAQTLDLGDCFEFAIERTDKLDDLIDGHAVRFRVEASVAGRLFERATLDVGFSKPIAMQPEWVTGPDHFAFVGIAPLLIPTLPLEYHVAEKLHAYTRIYSDGRRSSRVKDLIDLVLIAETSAFAAETLRRAIDVTFVSRGMQDVPLLIPEPPKAWATPYRALALDTGLAPDIATGHAVAARFLDPVLGGSTPDNARWQPGLATWSGG